MDQIDSISMHRAQSSMLQEMQHMAGMARGMFTANRVVSASEATGAGINTTQAVGRSIDSPSFSRVLNRAIDSVDQLQQVASAKQTAIDMGISDDLTGTMLESQKASVAFSAMVQVRNKLTSALDEIMNTTL